MSGTASDERHIEDDESAEIVTVRGESDDEAAQGGPAVVSTQRRGGRTWRALPRADYLCLRLKRLQAWPATTNTADSNMEGYQQPTPCFLTVCATTAFGMPPMTTCTVRFLIRFTSTDCDAAAQTRCVVPPISCITVIMHELSWHPNVI